jgi:hypothetical protein
MKTVSRIVILNSIFSQLQSAAQWISSQPNEYSNYLKKAEALIELLEIEDCGSTGGFDKNNKVKNVTSFKLFDRFLTVIRKHNKVEDIKSICEINVDDLSLFYKKIKESYSAI